MMIERLFMIVLTFYILLQVQDTRGQATQIRKKRNNVTILSRLSKQETMTSSIQKELGGIKSMLDDFQKVATETTSRLDELSGISVQRQAYDNVIKSTLDSFQDGLVSEKQHRIELDTIALQTKEILAKQNKFFVRKTELFEERDKQHRILLEQMEQETNDLNKQNKLFEKKAELFEERDKQHRILLEQMEQETNDLNKQNKLFEKKAELFEERDKQHRLELDTIALETKEMVAKTRVLENNITQLEQTCTNTCSVTTVAPAESTTSPARPAILSTRPPTTNPTTHKAKGCWGLKAVYGITEDGVYEVVSPDGRKINVRCDMTTDGGGWTVFQRRGDGSVRFDKTYAEYKSFFGNLSTEFWMGNDFLYEFTRNVKQTLRVDICNWDKETRWARYRHFSVSSSLDKYRLRVNNYSGTAGDAHIKGWSISDRGHNGLPFSAPDVDNDRSSSHCASDFHSGWWFNNCFSANLNGVYQPKRHSDNTWRGIQWRTWITKHSLKGTEVKIRPSTATPSTNEPFKCPVI